MDDHYSTLGVAESASGDEIKSAYRRLARELHPDRNPESAAAERFLAVQEAYSVLSNADRKEVYDRYRGIARARAEVRVEPQSEPVTESSGRVQTAGYFRGSRAWEPSGSSSSRESFLDGRRKSVELRGLLDRGDLSGAQRLAESMVGAGIQEGLAYSVLGDAARLKGDYREAARQYGFAVQADPGNDEYARLHVEMLEGGSAPSAVVDDPGRSGGSAFMLMVIVVVCAICYPALAKEPPVGLPLAESWTLGQIVMFVVSGIALGLGLRRSNLVGRFDLSSAGGRVHPLGVVVLWSLANFWIGAAIYGLSLRRRGFGSVSIDRVLVGVGVSVIGFAASRLGVGFDAAAETFLGCGVLVLLFAVMGWSAEDLVSRVRK